MDQLLELLAAALRQLLSLYVLNEETDERAQILHRQACRRDIGIDAIGAKNDGRSVRTHSELLTQALQRSLQLQVDLAGFATVGDRMGKGGAVDCRIDLAPAFRAAAGARKFHATALDAH